MKAPFKISWEEVTPAKAAEWLKKNTNRNLRSTTVDSFATDMVRGAWSPNHQAIAFDPDGNLIDGQHRLAAIVKSGRTIPFLICRDVPKQIEGVKTKVMDSIDRGNARSVADVLKLSHGYKTDASMVTAACVTIARLGVERPVKRVKKVSVPTIIAILARYRNGLAFVSENRPTTLGLRAAPISGAIAFAYDVAPNKTQDFYKRLSTGVGLDAESPILVLRNYALNADVSARGTTSERLDLAELVLHTLYCVIQRKEMARVPKLGARGGAFWFRQQQPQNLKYLESLFPLLEKQATPQLTPAAEKIVTAKDIKLTPAAEALLRDKDISDRRHGGLNSRVKKMQQRIARGEIRGSVK